MTAPKGFRMPLMVAAMLHMLKMHTPKGFRMPLMVAAMLHMLKMHTPRAPKKYEDRKAPGIPEGGRFTPFGPWWGNPDVPNAVNLNRRECAAAALEYGLKGGGRQKVRFRRWMREQGHAAFQRPLGEGTTPTPLRRAA